MESDPWNVGGKRSGFESVTEAVSFSAPAEKEGLTNIATLDGFANSTELKFERTIWRVSGELNRPGTLPERYNQFCRDAGLDIRCDSETVRDKLSEQGKTDLLAEFEDFMDDPNMRIQTWGGQFKIGHQEFDFFDPLLIKQDTNEIYWGVGAHYGWIPKHSSVLLHVGADWQRSYSPAKTGTACAAVDQSLFSCVTGALSAPSEKTKQLVYVEARGAISKPEWLTGPGEQMGISLRATHDFRNDEIGVDLPLYLLQAKDGGFTGGVRLGWTSTDQFGVGVFFGSALKLFD
jgi:hypothetical protein